MPPLSTFVFTKEDLDLSKANPLYEQKYVGLECKHYTVLSLYAVKRERRVNSVTGKEVSVVTPFFKVQCKYDESHQPIVPLEDITKFPERIRCPCHDKIRRMRVRERSDFKYAGEIIAGCECIRRDDEDTNWTSPAFVYKCSYCGKEFVRKRASMISFSERYPKATAGCDECMADRGLRFRSKWTKDDVRKAAETELRRAWQRIHNPFYSKYDDYGGRGIKMCPEWDPGYGKYTPDECIDNMTAFMLEKGWEPGYDLDRINTNGDYTIENCRFIPKIQQADNRRNTLCAQFGDEVFVGTEFVSVYKNSISSMRKNKVSPNSAQVNLYNRMYGVKRGIFVRYTDKLGFVDGDGYKVLVPPLRIFPKYPDDRYPWVSTYQEFLERLASNIAGGIRSRVPAADWKTLDIWVTAEDLKSVGLKPLRNYPDLIELMTRDDGIDT